MLKTGFKAALLLIVTENVTALKMFARNLANSIYKSTPKRRNAKKQDRKRL
jgi:hypothetical protein